MGVVRGTSCSGSGRGANRPGPARSRRGRSEPFPELFRTRLSDLGKDPDAGELVPGRGNAQHAVVSCPPGRVPNNTPTANSRTEPCITVTPSWPSLNTPKSHGSFWVSQLAAGVPSPSTRWPFRSSVTSSAPITIPWFGQLTRSLLSVVSAVIVSPQLTWLASARPPLRAIAPAAATTATRTATSKRVRIGRPFGRVQCATYCLHPPIGRVKAPSKGRVKRHGP